MAEIDLVCMTGGSKSAEKYTIIQYANNIQQTYNAGIGLVCMTVVGKAKRVQKHTNVVYSHIRYAKNIQQTYKRALG